MISRVLSPAVIWSQFLLHRVYILHIIKRVWLVVRCKGYLQWSRAIYSLANRLLVTRCCSFDCYNLYELIVLATMKWNSLYSVRFRLELFFMYHIIIYALLVRFDFDSVEQSLTWQTKVVHDEQDCND